VNLSKSAFRRYKVIDSVLRNPMKRFPRMADFIEACHAKLDFYPSEETIQKDIANMRMPYPDGFDAPIRYNRSHRGYEYTDPDYALLGVSLRQEEIDAISEALDVIRYIGGARMSDKFNHAVEKILSLTLEGANTEGGSTVPIIQTMVPPVSRGFEHIELIYKACREHIPLSFIHFSYKKRTFNHVILHPFMIKEFENRWYVIGHSEQHEGIRTFGLDRVTEPLLIKQKYRQTDPHLVNSYLNDVFGVFPIPGAKKELIQVHVSQLGTHYFQAYPLHISQSIKKESEGTSFISFNLIASVELARYFLSQGRHLKIVKPKWLKEFTENLAE
jgi:predicted DNA-binding transcriptional regulator YafY